MQHCMQHRLGRRLVMMTIILAEAAMDCTVPPGLTRNLQQRISQRQRIWQGLASHMH